MLEKIRDDLKKSMKASDKLRTRTLRMLLTDCKLAQVAKKDDLEEGDILQIIKKNIKQRKESAKLYLDGDRSELAEQEEGEAKILEEYLPQQLGDDEVKKEAEKVIQEMGVELKKDMGRVMKEFMSRFKGKVDGKKVQGIVQTLLK